VVQAIEEGYDGGLTDYTQDLLSRLTIWWVERHLPAWIAEKMEEALRPWDERFRRVTRPPRPGEALEGRRQWWDRLPVRPGARLAGDLARRSAGAAPGKVGSLLRRVGAPLSRGLKRMIAQQKEDEERKWEAIFEAFAPLAPALDQFAWRHELLITKYEREWPSWDFPFLRHLGGMGTVGVLFDVERGDRFEIWAWWFLDDREKRLRYSRRMLPPLEFRRGGELTELTSLLERALGTVDSWELGEWDEISGPYEEWRRLPREDPWDDSDWLSLR